LTDRIRSWSIFIVSLVVAGAVWTLIAFTQERGNRESADQ